MVVWCGVNQLIIHFRKEFIPLSSHYSIRPFLQIILMQNSNSDPQAPSSSNKLCLLFCIYPSSMRTLLQKNGLTFLLFCLRGCLPLYLEMLQYTQWPCSASGSLWEMPDSNPGPLPKMSGALSTSHHISTSTFCQNENLSAVAIPWKMFFQSK